MFTKISTQVSKTCGGCGQTKIASEFYRDRSKKSGLDSWCKCCGLEKARLYRLSGKALLAVLKYGKTTKGRAKRKAYRQSEKYKEYARNYSQSDRGRFCRYRFRAKPEEIKRTRDRNREFVKSGKSAIYKKKRYYELQNLSGRACHPDWFYPAYLKLQALKTAEVVEIKP